MMIIMIMINNDLPHLWKKKGEDLFQSNVEHRDCSIMLWGVLLKRQVHFRK